MRLTLIIGLALACFAWLQATALLANTAGVELYFAQAINVYSGWLGLALAGFATLILTLRTFRTRTESK